MPVIGSMVGTPKSPAEAGLKFKGTINRVVLSLLVIERGALALGGRAIKPSPRKRIASGNPTTRYASRSKN
jgi:hypothetical protein